jgi:hypothetical protein
VSRKKRIACKRCGETYRDINVPGATQASDCASAVFEKNGALWVKGYYGSRLWDMTLLRVVEQDKRKAIEPMDPVCDLCIQEWVRWGLAVVVCDNVMEGEEDYTVRSGLN